MELSFQDKFRTHLTEAVHANAMELKGCGAIYCQVSPNEGARPCVVWIHAYLYYAPLRGVGCVFPRFDAANFSLPSDLMVTCHPRGGLTVGDSDSLTWLDLVQRRGLKPTWSLPDLGILYVWNGAHLFGDFCRCNCNLLLTKK